MKAARHSPIRLAQRILLAGLLLCMALAQSLSIVHSTLHHDVQMLAHTHEERQLEHAHHYAHEHGAECDHGIFNRLFAGHQEGDETCRLMDGAGTFLEINSPVGQLLPAAAAHVLIAIGDSALAAWQAPLFEARGPPAFSL